MNDLPGLVLVVEGVGEVEAAPVLIRRIFSELFQIHYVEIEVQRRSGISHLKANDWAHFRRYLEATYYYQLPVLWMFDADDDCPLDIIDDLVNVSNEVGVLQPTAYTLWYREYETMFLYDPSTIIRRFKLNHLSPIANEPEAIRGAKGWISRQLDKQTCYKETIDQPAMSAIVDLENLRNNYSCFKHLVNTIEWLLNSPGQVCYPN